MATTLRDDDCRAIDLLLDRGTAAAGGNNGKDVMNSDAMTATSYSNPVDPDRLHGVEQVLGLLNYLPDEEPPVGMVERTLARIEQSVGRSAGDHAAFRAALRPDPSVPHA